MKLFFESFDLTSGSYLAWGRVLDCLDPRVALVNLGLFWLIFEENIMHFSDPVGNFRLKGMGKLLVDIVLHHLWPIDTFFGRLHLPFAEITSKLEHKAGHFCGDLLQENIALANIDLQCYFFLL